MDLCQAVCCPFVAKHQAPFLHELLSYPTVLILSRFALGSFGCRVSENISFTLKEKNDFRSLLGNLNSCVYLQMNL